MSNPKTLLHSPVSAVMASMLALLSLTAIPASPAAALQDPAEPHENKPRPKLLLRPSGATMRLAVDERSMRALVTQLVACGTRNSLSSWSDPQHGIGCGRDRIVARFQEIAKQSGGRLQVVVDKFEATAARTNNQPAPFENVYGILPGTDAKLRKTVFIVSGHFDSMPSNVMDAQSDAPGADDDASGAAVSVECARLLATPRPTPGSTRISQKPEPPEYRATLLFAAVSGEEQGLLGGTRLLEWVRQQGYTVGGMLDDDIVGADFAPGSPHRVRLFSGNGDEDDCDSPSRELARAIEEIDGRPFIRMVFRLDRFGRGGDHYPFYKAGLPAVRFTEPLEDYHHEHQTPRTEEGVEYGDLEKFLNFTFMGNVARDNAEALRQLALAPAAPTQVRLAGAVTPDATISWQAEDDAERAGFEILWRETSEARWQVYDMATSPGEAILKGVSTDNHFFAVRAVGKNGARSIAAPAVMERRAPAPAGSRQ